MRVLQSPRKIKNKTVNISPYEKKLNAKISIFWNKGNKFTRRPFFF